MPLPSIRKNESKKDFIKRFMSNKEAKKTFKEIKQRLAVAHERAKRK